MKKKILRFIIRAVALLLGVVLAAAFGWHLVLGIFCWGETAIMLLHWSIAFVSFVGYNALFHFVWETRRKKKK